MTMGTATLYIDGIAWWSPGLPGWPQARAMLCGDGSQRVESGEAGSRTDGDGGARPAPALLAANERRRAPESVLLALEVASQAVAASGHDAAQLASVFTSAHGDAAITDALCRTLAGNPLLLSPTRFHHSVHNAASGYWAIGSGSQAATTALSAFRCSFAAGLLEAASQCAADSRPVLLVGCDIAGVGALASVNRSRGALALALVLAPARGLASQWAVEWRLQAAAAPLHASAARALADNAMADGLPLFQALAAGRSTQLALPVSDALHVELALRPL